MFTHLKRFLKIFNLFSILALLAALLGGAVTFTPARAAGVLFVQPPPTGSGDCSSWANACTLQTAISNSVSGDQIWVKAGTHKPHPSDRTVSFTLKNGVAIYGGFITGDETLLSQRNPNPNTNGTTLSGDLNDDDSGFTNNVENSYQVVNGNSTNSTAILDGFTIRGGNANGTSPDDVGGGMFNPTNSTPTLNNVIFSGNFAAGGGGGMRNEFSSPTLTNMTFSGNSSNYGGAMNNFGSSPNLTIVTFSGNSATNSGGAMSNYNSNPSLKNVTFSANTAAAQGGGMNNNTSSPSLTNVTFSGNSANNSAGGMYNFNNSSPTLMNTIIANSTSGGDCVNSSTTLNPASSNNLIENPANACGLTNGVNGNKIGVDPKLGALANNGGYTQTMALQIGSPAIDAGKQLGCPAQDQRGAERPQGAGCDIGAFEANGAGGLDRTFSGDGRVTTNVVPSDLGRSDQIWGIAIQPDGKIVVAGNSFIPSTTTSDFALARYNANGALDTTFSGDGRLITNFGGIDEAWDVAVQSDGKIIAAGRKCISGSCDVALARYNANGTFDTTFSGDGKQITDFGGVYAGGDNGSNGGLAIQSDGKIVVAGYMWNGTDYDLAVYRYNANGSLDTTFSGDGMGKLNFGAGKQDYTYDLAIQADGKIVVAGRTGDDGNNDDFAIARLNANGTADLTFSGDGRQTTNFGKDDSPFGLALQPNGKIVVVGEKRDSISQVAVARYNTNGSLDLTFNGTGKKVFSMIAGRASRAWDVIVQSDGKIVMGGVTDNPANDGNFILVRLNGNGAFDATFSGDGKVTIDFTRYDHVYALARQSDGKYVLGGSTGDDGVPDDFALARVLP